MAPRHSHDRIVRLETPRLTIEGKSIAGNESYFRVRELGIALDIGRCPDLLVAVRDVFVTHAHLDHALGIPYHASQRRLQRLGPGRIHVPSESVAEMAELIRVHERLLHTEVEIELVPAGIGERIDLRPGLAVRAHEATHSIPARAWEVLEIRRKLRDEFRDLAQDEIARRIGGGEELTRVEETPLLFYTGDTDRGIFQKSPALFEAPVLMIECTFTEPEDRARAERHAHIHSEDLWEVADRFRNEVILLTHFSLRGSPSETHATVRSRCPERLRDRIRLAFPPPWDRLAG